MEALCTAVTSVATLCGTGYVALVGRVQLCGPTYKALRDGSCHHSPVVWLSSNASTSKDLKGPVNRG